MTPRTQIYEPLVGPILQCTCMDRCNAFEISFPCVPFCFLFWQTHTLEVLQYTTSYYPSVIPSLMNVLVNYLGILPSGQRVESWHKILRILPYVPRHLEAEYAVSFDAAPAALNDIFDFVKEIGIGISLFNEVLVRFIVFSLSCHVNRCAYFIECSPGKVTSSLYCLNCNFGQVVMGMVLDIAFCHRWRLSTEDDACAYILRCFA